MPLSGSFAHEGEYFHHFKHFKHYKVVPKTPPKPSIRLIQYNTQIIPGSGLWVVASLRLHL